MNKRSAGRESWVAIGILWSVVALNLFIHIEPLGASSFSISPVQIFLSAQTTSGLLTLRNQSDRVLRFQLTATTWNQTPQGEMQLGPTKDLVFFPTLLSLAPNEERHVRVGIATTFAPVEKTYRLFVEELPSLESAQSAASGVAVLTKLGVPVFLQPPKPSGDATLQNLRASNSMLRFELLNTGNAHFIPRSIRIRALAESGEVISTHEPKAWYVLAGGTREFAVELPPATCDRIRTIAVDVQVGESDLRERLDAVQPLCSAPSPPSLPASTG